MSAPIPTRARTKDIDHRGGAARQQARRRRARAAVVHHACRAPSKALSLVHHGSLNTQWLHIT